jgi:hypothetical protein
VRAWKTLPLFLPVLFCGCTPTFGSASFDRNVIRERLKDGSIQMPDSTIAAARDLKAQLRFPCRIAVYLQPESGDWRWTQDDKIAMEAWASVLKKEGIATDVFTLPQILTAKSDKGDLKELRVAAAKCGADVLLVIQGAAQTTSYKNFAAVFNLTIVGGFIIPASHSDSLFAMEGVLLDVDNGYIYTAVQAEGVGKIMRPTFVIEDKDAVALAKTKAVAVFSDEVLKRMRVLATLPPPADRVGRIIIEGTEPAKSTGDKVVPISNLDLHPVGVSDVPAIKPTPDRVGRIVIEGKETGGDRVIPNQLNAGGVMTGITAPRPLP